MAELNLSINFTQPIAHRELIGILSPAYQLNPGDRLNLSISLSNNMVHSDSLLIVASGIDHMRQDGVDVQITIQGESTYASRINFYRLIDVPFNEQFIRRNNAGRFIELKSFDKDSLYPLQDELNMILYQNGGINKEVLQLLFYCLSEIMDNIIVHSGLEKGWVSAQYYPNRHEIRLTICDHGDGIHHSLTHNPKSRYKEVTEPEALDLCIQRGVTNGEGLGFGLFATSQFILKNDGDLLIYSGNHYLLAHHGDYQIHEGNYYKGTLVSLRINTDVPVDYKSIMPAHHTLPDDYDFFIDKYFGENNELW
ncbi:ATP-binding protein [Mucilaginibacter sp. KACC 22773]|uniref:ATP-binding protein n=1 Tax=Mucilaginibacter sp. KACC 22773 TaxID=3025671 RepID=UPI0023661C39|nr:ATP-binding protein [Mucilaginibacter sp. KACC 22773]WDF77123.1 ATP-binding protein [Mucilaginibacter sp. KACC 22773]